MKKYIVGMSIALFVSNVQGMEYPVRWQSLFDSVTATSTNLTLKIPLLGFIGVLNEDSIRKYNKEIGWNTQVMPWQSISEFRGEDKALVLTPNQETRIGGHSHILIFTPVSFQNQQKGFRVAHTTATLPPVPSRITYIALGDTPTPMSADDVEMIWDRKLDHTGRPTGWRRYEGDQVMAYPPPPETPPPVTQAKRKATPAIFGSTSSSSTSSSSPSSISYARNGQGVAHEKECCYCCGFFTHDGCFAYSLL